MYTFWYYQSGLFYQSLLFHFILLYEIMDNSTQVVLGLGCGVGMRLGCLLSKTNGDAGASFTLACQCLQTTVFFV